MSSATRTNAAQPASFVSGLAWSFIGLTALSMLLAAFQYVLFAHVVPVESLRAAFSDAISLGLLPSSILKVLVYLPTFCIALFCLSLLTLLVSIALLKRKNWARITFAWIMIATAILHFAGLLLPFYIAQDVSNTINSMPPEVHNVAIMMTKMFSVVSMGMGVVFGIAFAWISKRLFSAQIAREFVADTEN